MNARRLDKERAFNFSTKQRVTKLNSGSRIKSLVLCYRARIHVERIMSMRCICTWKAPEEAGGARRSKARLVLRGYTQILKVRPEAPTISRLGCQTLHLACSSHHWNLFKGDVKPAFLQGGKELESSRNISCDPLPEVRKKLNISDAQILKVEGGCYGLRTAPPLRSHFFFHFSFCFFLFCWEGVEFGRGVTPPSSPPPKPKLVGILLRSSVKFGND